jgi:phage shock protein PspC (stress-responsive transcriptional regulator)
MDNPAPPTTERPPSGDPPHAQTQAQTEGPRVTRDQVKDLSRLRRSITDRHVGGVSGGLARHLDIDPILVRVAFVVAVFLGGAGLLAYAGAWILVPEEGTPDEPLGLDERSRGVALAGVGILAVLAAVGNWAGAFWFPWPVAIVALVVLWLVSRSQSGSRPAPYTGTYTGTSTGQPAYPHASATPYPGEQSVAPGAGPVGPQPGTPVTYARLERPRNPRKRGPILFWFTLALIALAEGVLGVVDAAGADVVPSAYPALALAVTTAMLLLGAFWGRAGGLVLVGAVAAAATGISATASSWDEQSLRSTPEQAADVSGYYELDKGELVLDLTGVEDVDGLDGHDIRIDGGVGRIEVVVPAGMDVQVTADVGVGDVRLFEERADGLGVTQEGFLDGGTDAPELEITIDMGVGEVVVREDGAPR